MKILEHDPAVTDDPRSMTDVQLARLGIQLVDRATVRLRCVTCGLTWVPQVDCQGTPAYGYWQCPRGCNKEHE